MDTVVTREFVRAVFARVRSSSGLPLLPKTIENYTHRIMTLKNRGYFKHVNDPEILYSVLRLNYSNPVTVLTTMKTAAVFVSNLTEQEKAGFNVCSTQISEKYREKVTLLNIEVKDQQMKRVQGAQFFLGTTP